MFIGYARVSTSNQDTRLQLDALKAASVHEVYSENESSTGPRPQLQQAIKSRVVCIYLFSSCCGKVTQLEEILSQRW